MGLLDLFLQNKTTLDVEQIPTQGNGPVGTPTGEFNTGVTSFQQIWDSNKTYINSFIGGTNVGIQPPTLKETGLDIDNPNYIPSTSTPNTLTAYPATALGGLGQSAVQFLQIWSPVINYNDVVVGAPTSPLKQSLPETGLDNTDSSAVPTTVSPINLTDYPSLAKGEYNSVSNQYTQIYGPSKTYLDNYDPNVQPNSLDETGLDIENIGLVSTTAAPSTNTQYPNLAAGEFGGQSNNFNQIYTPVSTYLNTFNPNVQPDTIIQGQTGLDNINPAYTPTTVTPYNPTNYPNQSKGEFGGASSQYSTPYGPNSTYENTYVNSPINFDTLQPTTLDETGLDNTNLTSAPTTVTPIDSTSYPQYVQGEFNGAPILYNQAWGPGFGYLANYNPNIQPNTLGQTGLDNTNTSFALTTTTPATPTIYPQFAQGEFNGAPTQYFQTWGPNNQYFINYNPNTQPNTLDETGLDIENSNALPTTTIPSTVTQYPQFVQGEFNTAPNQYAQVWGPTNQYIINYNSNIQPNTVLGGETGLDNTNLLAFNTTFVPNAITAPTNYPQPAQTYLGEFQGAPSQFTPLYNPNPGQSYLDNYNTIISNAGNQQVNTLGQTDLDNSNSNSSPTTVQNIDPTVYPLFVQGEFNSAPNLYNQIWNPNFGYYLNSNPSAQTDTLDETGLDIENKTAAPTTYVVPETDDTVYPVIQGAFTINRIPKPYTQTYTPTNQYYSYMINDFEGQVK
jgi:hypothetical protein